MKAFKKHGTFQYLSIPPSPKGGEADKKASKKNLRDQMKEENVIDSKCSVCREKNKGIKKCNGCYSAWYCGQKCQREDWPRHRDQSNLSTELPSSLLCMSKPSKLWMEEPSNLLHSSPQYYPTQQFSAMV